MQSSVSFGILIAPLLLVALSGCTTGADARPDPSEPVGVITDPRDLSASASGSHVHDYWKGASTLDVLDYSQTSNWNSQGGGGNYYQHVFRPGDGSVVPQGTKSLTIAVDWTESNPANAFGVASLWVKTADSNEPRFVQEIASGTAVELPVLYNQSDLPHQLISNWEFTTRYNDSGQPYNLFQGTIHVSVEAHRGYELQPFPPHPDQWQGRNAIQVIDASGTFFRSNYWQGGNTPPRLKPESGLLVPGSASFVEVTLTQTTDYGVGRLDLQYHGADTRNFTTVPPESVAGSVSKYTIPVGPGMGDGPYSVASLWEFRLVPPPVTNPEPALYSGDYAITATALR